ncbi:unnamed protein product [Angiostrongylus costaricensis]|uniref:Uncharacterized protein n=1 Tax=Angiostrongylus costaricensis TaxID=334426 RepID=A0A0R3PSL3_ANGCS|nr:unnamed protein product [Angiostrongylus costaricensis]
MRPFVEGHGYWLCVPKPWNGRRFTNPEERVNASESRMSLDDFHWLQKDGKITSITRVTEKDSHYSYYQSEDEDPVDMWNRSIETSVACQSPNALSSALSTSLWNSSSRKRVHLASKVSRDQEVVESPIAASTAIRPIVEPSHVEISCEDIERVFEESPLVISVPNVELSDKAPLNIENDENSPTPAFSSEDSSKQPLRQRMPVRLIPSRSTVRLLKAKAILFKNLRIMRTQDANPELLQDQVRERGRESRLQLLRAKL